MWDEDSFSTTSFSTDSWLFALSTTAKRFVGTVFVVGVVATLSIIQRGDSVRVASYR